jgi:DNA-directed RNA polymerase specialized sigma24 family protein
MNDNNNRILAEINQKLSVLILLNALNLTAQKDIDQKRKVVLLSKAGYTSQEIGDMLHMRAESVRRLRSRAKSS